MEAGGREEHALDVPGFCAVSLMFSVALLECLHRLLDGEFWAWGVRFEDL